jgi:DNA-binding transcriptional LysR family regulator
MSNNILNFNLNYLQHYYHVVTCGGFSKASEKLNISQPAISYSIKCLEETFGAKLIIRSKNGIALTDEGDLVYDTVKAFLGKIESIKDNIENKDTNKKYEIKLDVPPHKYLFISEPISSYIKEHPEVNLVFYDSTSEIYSDYINKGIIDVIVDSAPAHIQNEMYMSTPLTTINTCFIYNEDYFDLSNLNSIAELDKYPIILPSKGTNLRKRLDDFTKNNYKMVYSPQYESYYTEIIIDMVKDGSAIGFVYEKAISPLLKSRQIKKISLPDSSLSHDICMVTKKNETNEIVLDFINYIKSNI